MTKTKPIKTKLFVPVVPMMATSTAKNCRRVKTPNQIVETMYNYLIWCNDNNKRPTKAGFAIAMNFPSTDAILAWCKRNKLGKVSYNDGLIRAYTIMQDVLDNVLVEPGNKNGNGMFRYMQNAYGYRDKVDQNTNTTSRVIRLPARATKGTEVDRTQRKKLSRNKSKSTTGSGKKL